jgi:hypothetical protein
MGCVLEAHHFTLHISWHEASQWPQSHPKTSFGDAIILLQKVQGKQHLRYFHPSQFENAYFCHNGLEGYGYGLGRFETW